jgi:hypothetical protein
VKGGAPGRQKREGRMGFTKNNTTKKEEGVTEINRESKIKEHQK